MLYMISAMGKWRKMNAEFTFGFNFAVANFTLGFQIYALPPHPGVRFVAAFLFVGLEISIYYCDHPEHDVPANQS